MPGVTGFSTRLTFAWRAGTSVAPYPVKNMNGILRAARASATRKVISLASLRSSVTPSNGVFAITPQSLDVEGLGGSPVRKSFACRCAHITPSEHVNLLDGRLLPVRARDRFNNPH